MTDQKHLTLPILGMTCANCVATVERNLKKVDGVESANVNLSSERAAVTYDPAQANLANSSNVSRVLVTRSPWVKPRLESKT
jgi:P-type Cu+ transporter